MVGNTSQQLQGMLVQQQNPAQHQNRMQMQSLLQGGPGQAPNAGPQGQTPMTQQQQWFKQQQMQQQQQLMRQQQQQQFQQPPAPPYQRLPAIRQPHMGYTNTFQDQNFPSMQGLKPTPPPVPSPQGVMGPPQGSISLQQQHQLIQSVRSPPPITSPQPNPSPRPTPSPRNQPVPSPRGPQPSPHELAASEMLLGQNHASGLHPHASPASQNQETGDMTPQDQLTKFVEQL